MPFGSVLAIGLVGSIGTLGSPSSKTVLTAKREQAELPKSMTGAENTFHYVPYDPIAEMLTSPTGLLNPLNQFSPLSPISIFNQE